MAAVLESESAVLNRNTVVSVEPYISVVAAPDNQTITLWETRRGWETHASWYAAHCGHPTDAVEKNREAAAAERKHALLYDNPFVHDRYGHGQNVVPKIPEEVKQ